MRWNISQHPMLQRKLYDCESSSMSLEWHPPLMILSCYTAIALEPLLKRKNRSHISTPSTFCIATIWSCRSWIEMTSNFRRLTERRIWSIYLLKPSISRSSKIINWRWVYDTILIGFSPSESCWKLYPKVNHQLVDSWANYCNCIWIIKIINII